MRSILSLALISAFVFASCSEEEKPNKFSPPQINRFDLMKNGDVLIFGKGMEELKGLDITFDFSVTTHEFTGASAIMNFGTDPTVLNDTTLLITAKNINKMECYLRSNGELGGELKKIIDTDKKNSQDIVRIDKKSYLPVLQELGNSEKDCTLWLTLKDTSKLFWDPNNPSTAFTTFGHYQLYSYAPGNNSGYDYKVLMWKKKEEKK